MRGDPAPLGLIMVDDNVPAAEAMQQWCDSSGTLRWLGSADRGEAALAMIAEHQPSIVLLDVEIPGTDSFDLLSRIVAQSPGTAVVMFSGHCHPDLIGRALSGGAAGYILKDEPVAALADLLLRAAGGECVLSLAAAAAYMRAGAAEQ